MGSHKKHKKEKKRRKKEKKHKKKRKHHSSSSDTSSGSSPRRETKRLKKSHEDSVPKKHVVNEETDEDYSVPLPPGFVMSTPEEGEQSSGGADKPVRLPMTKEQYEAKANQIRRVFDPLTGRQRLIRGEGEVIEECVSRDRHKQINAQATRGDGEVFQRTLQASLKKR